MFTGGALNSVASLYPGCLVGGSTDKFALLRGEGELMLETSDSPSMPRSSHSPGGSKYQDGDGGFSMSLGGGPGGDGVAIDGGPGGDGGHLPPWQPEICDVAQERLTQGGNARGVYAGKGASLRMQSLSSSRGSIPSSSTCPARSDM